MLESRRAAGCHGNPSCSEADSVPLTPMFNATCPAELAPDEEVLKTRDRLTNEIPKSASQSLVSLDSRVAPGNYQRPRSVPPSDFQKRARNRLTALSKAFPLTMMKKNPISADTNPAGGPDKTQMSQLKHMPSKSSLLKMLRRSISRQNPRPCLLDQNLEQTAKSVEVNCHHHHCHRLLLPFQRQCQMIMWYQDFVPLAIHPHCLPQNSSSQMIPSTIPHADSLEYS